MTQKDFGELAEIVKHLATTMYLDRDAHKRLAETMAVFAAKRYKGPYSFRKEKFLKACGVEQ